MPNNRFRNALFTFNPVRRSQNPTGTSYVFSSSNATFSIKFSINHTITHIANFVQYILSSHFQYIFAIHHVGPTSNRIRFLSLRHFSIPLIPFCLHESWILNRNKDRIEKIISKMCVQHRTTEVFRFTEFTAYHRSLPRPINRMHIFGQNAFSLIYYVPSVQNACICSSLTHVVELCVIGRGTRVYHQPNGITECVYRGITHVHTFAL